MTSHHRRCTKFWAICGLVTYLKLVQIACQLVVEALCLLYLGPRNYENRPATTTGLFVGVAMSLGCIVPAVERIYSLKFEARKGENHREMTGDHNV